MPPVRLSSVRLAAPVALLASALALSGTATAAPYEQVDRAAGAFGDAPLFGSTPRGVAVGDVGRYAGFEVTPRIPRVGDGTRSGFVRDIQTNTTIDYGGGVRRIYGIDRAEKRALILRTRNGKFQVVAVPIAGGAPIIVSERAISEIEPEAALSGDGRKVVLSDSSRTGLYDLTGGTATYTDSLGYDSLSFSPNSLSDTASVIVARMRNSNDWVRILTFGGNRFPVAIPGATSARVDAAGTTIAYTVGQQLAIQDFRAQTERRVPLAWNVNGVLWVGDRGAKVVVGREGYNTAPAKSFTPATNTWSAYGDRFARWIFGDSWEPTPISPNGRFVLFRSGGIVLADATGAHITGANEGLAASAYIRGGTTVERCSDPATFAVAMVAPNFAPAPTKAVVTVKLGGTVIGSGTLTQSVPSDYPYAGGEGPEWLVEGEYPSTSTGDVTISATVTDGAGRTLNGTWTVPDEYDCY